jgi:hypothetical protein
MSRFSNALIKEASSIVLSSEAKTNAANAAFYAGVEAAFRDTGVVLAFEPANSNSALADDILYYTATIKSGSFEKGDVKLECKVATKAQYDEAAKKGSGITVKYDETSHLMNITEGKNTYSGQKLDGSFGKIVGSALKGINFEYNPLATTYEGTGNLKDNNGKDWKLNFQFTKGDGQYEITKFDLYLAPAAGQDKSHSKSVQKQ